MNIYHTFEGLDKNEVQVHTRNKVQRLSVRVLLLRLGRVDALQLHLVDVPSDQRLGTGVLHGAVNLHAVVERDVGDTALLKWAGQVDCGRLFSLRHLGVSFGRCYFASIDDADQACPFSSVFDLHGRDGDAAILKKDSNLGKVKYSCYLELCLVFTL